MILRNLTENLERLIEVFWRKKLARIQFQQKRDMVATPTLGFSPSLRLRFILQNVSLLILYICATTQFT